MFVAMIYFNFTAGSRVDNNAFTNLTNVANRKTVKASSKHYIFSPENAVDGNIENFMHTEPEDKPWFLIDLGGIFMIQEIEIINRQDCCGNVNLYSRFFETIQ